MEQRVAAIYLADGFNSVEVVGFLECVDLVPGLEAVTVAEESGQLVSSDGRSVTIAADRGRADVQAAEVLYVPGCRVMPLLEDGDLLAWVRRIDETSRFTTAMCVGRALLAAAGVLRGRRVALQPVPLPAHCVIEVGHRLVVDGKYATGANAASAFDLGLWVAGQYLDPVQARAVQVALEYEVDTWGPPFGERPQPAPTEQEQHALMGLMTGGIRTQIIAEIMQAAESEEPTEYA